jgi:P pilus assembly chaperone PapD
MKRMIPFVLVLLSSLSALAYSAPDIQIGAMHEYMATDKSTLRKRIRNNGDSTAFVKVTVDEIVYDKTTGKPVEQPAATIASGKNQQPDTVIASPARLIIPANGMQATRLLAMGSRAEERYFRVRFIPVLPETGANFGLTATETEQYKTSLSAGVTMLTGYGAIVIVHPRNARYDTQREDGQGEYTVRNNGNATVVLKSVSDCQADGDACGEPSTIYLRPNKSHTFNKETGHTYRFDLIEGDRKKAITFKS